MPIERLNEIWPEWTVQEQIGEGSFGKVYKAVHVEPGIDSAYAAIKVIPIPKSQSEIDSIRSEGLGIDGTKSYFRSIVNDFANEIKLMNSLKGAQNIVSVEDFRVIEKTSEIGWDIFIRMELLTPFNAYISDKKLTEEEVIKLGIDICIALEICSKRNIIHRDIKPENIFVNDFGCFKLGDFGIARKLENMTDGLSQKGTVNYMAPEVAFGKKYDARVDIYSLGIVLYKLLNNNRLPFLDAQKKIFNHHEHRNAIERRMGGQPLPPPCEASPEMADLILTACAFEPEHRFASASAMKKALMSVMGRYYSDIPLKPAANDGKEPEQEKARNDNELIKPEKVGCEEKEAVSSDTKIRTRGNNAEDLDKTVLLQQDASAIDKTVTAKRPEEEQPRQVKDEPLNANNDVFSGNADYARAKDAQSSNEAAAEHSNTGGIDETVAIRMPEEEKAQQGQVDFVADKAIFSDEERRSGTRQARNLNETVAVLHAGTENNEAAEEGEPEEDNAKQDKSSSARKTRIAVISAVICLCVFVAGFMFIRGVTTTTPDDQPEYDSNDSQPEYDLDGSHLEYDSNGNMVKKTRFNQDGTIKKYEKYEYDSKGNLIKEISFNQDDTIRYYMEYEYDQKGNKERQTNFNSDGTVDSYSVFKFNSKGNKAKETCYSPNGIICCYYEHEYDSNGKETKKSEYDLNDEIKYCWEFDKNGKEIKMSYYDSGAIYFYIENKYDSKGNLLKTTNHSSDVKKYNYIEYEYDSKGNMTKETCYNPDSTIYSYYKHEYDSKGNEVKESWHGSDGTMSSYQEYAYDSNGNLEKRTWYNSDGTVSKIIGYDLKGNETYISWYNDDGAISSVEEYNSYGKWIKNTKYYSDGAIKSISEYTSYGKVAKQTTYNPDGTVWFIDLHEFDSKGKITKNITYNPDGTISAIFEYDSNGNWVQVK